MTNVYRRHYSILRGATFFLCVAFSSNLFAAASNQYCNNDLNQNHLGFSHSLLESESTDAGAEVDFTQEELMTGMAISDEEYYSMAMDFNFQYTIIDFDDTITPMTNGHLHSWDFPVSWRSDGKGYELNYHLAPVLAVSSNALKNSDLIDGESLQLWAGLVYKKELNKKSAWLLGIRSDHRFGRYLAYPVVGLCWQPNKDWQLQLALPDISIRKSYSNKINIRFFAEPEGNQWHVFSDDETRDSDFTYEAIVTGLSIEWRASSEIRMELKVKSHTRRRFSFELDDETPVKSRAESSAGITVSADVIF